VKLQRCFGMGGGDEKYVYSDEMLQLIIPFSFNFYLRAVLVHASDP